MMQLATSTIFEFPIHKLNPSPPICVPKGSHLKDVIALIQRHQIGCVLVTENTRLEGIITERDLALHIVGKNINPESTRVDAYMTSKPECLQLSDPISYALNRMNLGGFRHIPIVNNNMRPVGVISVKDIVNLLVDEFPDAIMNLPPEPRIYPYTREGA